MAAVSLTSGLLLVLPDGAVRVLGLSELPAALRPWIGVLFLGSSSYLVAHVGFSVVGTMRDRAEDQARAERARMEAQERSERERRAELLRIERAKERLHHLTLRERSVLARLS